MRSKDTPNYSRREFLRTAGGTAALVALKGLPVAAQERAAVSSRPMRIGIIGSGRIGGTLGELWVKAGHEVLFSSRHPDQLKDLVQRLGPRTRAGMPGEAAAFGEAVLISVPYAALPQIGRDFVRELAGKVVIETGNPAPKRDGEMAVEALAKGTGIASAGFLPGVRLIRAFNALNYKALASEAHRPGDRVAIPLAGDDQGALAVASRLIQDAGFEPVVVGPLARAKDFDPGTPVYVKVLTAREMRERLGLDQAPKP
jgi:predicted dinucleotide-binding enzyme